MPSGRKNIYKDAKGFDKNPENINRNGRPPKLYSDCIKELKTKGFKPPSKSEYFEMVGMLIVLTESELIEFQKNKQNPLWLRLIITDLNNKNTRQKLMTDYRDWIYGKAEQKTTNENNDNVNVNLSKTDINQFIEKLKQIE
jgi:hypothetical protein